LLGLRGAVPPHYLSQYLFEGSDLTSAMSFRVGSEQFPNLISHSIYLFGQVPSRPLEHHER
jgi:hypothetical protein